LTGCSLGFVLVGAGSCLVTSMFWQFRRRRGVRRLLRRASLHPDPDRRLSALFVAALDGLGRHLDLVLACTQTETAEAVRTSLVDLVLEEQWRNEHDQRVVAVRAWARAVLAEQRHSLTSNRVPLNSSHRNELSCPPLHGLDALVAVEAAAAAAYGTAPSRAARRSAAPKWARPSGGPEIDALEVVDAVGRHDRRAAGGRGARRTTNTISGTASTDSFELVFEALIEDGRAGNGSTWAGPRRVPVYERTDRSASTRARFGAEPGHISAAL